MLKILAVLLSACAAAAQDASSVKSKLAEYKMGHSHLGQPFDVGPRQKPWLMEGIGKAHFPISTRNPEVQKWFDQGVTLLHSFWDYEAERVPLVFEAGAGERDDVLGPGAVDVGKVVRGICTGSIQEKEDRDGTGTAIYRIDGGPRHP